MTIYLAGPMTGIPEFNYPAFRAAVLQLRGQGRNVVSPHELHDGDTTREYAYYLRRDLQALLGCHEVVLLPGWQNSKGARLEVAIAEALGTSVTELAELNFGEGV